ncbi:MAG: ribosome maturation factor RimP [Candidatus Eisenbacteria bacterium]
MPVAWRPSPTGRRCRSIITKEQLEALVAPLLREAGAELVQVQILPGGRQVRLRLFVDRAGGITVGQCGELSRQIARELERFPDLASGYALEVSSPGMDRPISTLEHFRRFAGERVTVDLVAAREGRSRFSGSIDAVEGERIRLRLDGGEVLEIGPADLAGARLDLDPWKPRARARPACTTEKGREQEP